MKLQTGLIPRFGFLLLAAATLRCDGGTDPGNATRIEMVSGNGQDATVGTTLPDSLIVRVTDQNGDPVQGVAVAWAAQGGGSVSAASVESGDDGLAGVLRTLGTTPGDQTATATVTGLDGSPVQFTATAVDGPPPEPGLVITTQPPSAALDGEVFAADAQPVVRLLGEGGVPVAGVTVTAALGSGSGTLEGGATAVTGPDGVAEFGDLGIAGQGSHTIEFTAPGVSTTSSAIALSALPAEATTGEWGPVVSWDIVPLHMTLLPTAKILAWGRNEIGGGMGQPRLWDPASGSPAGAITVANDTMLFCAGHALMADGKLMVSGGHKADDRGLDVTNIFDPATQSWTPGLPKMAHGRWYPTVTTLPDGRLVTVAGQDSASNVVKIPEVWENGAWTELPGAADVELPYYPRNFIDPLDGRVFMAGERITSRWLDVEGGVWVTGDAHIWPFNRDYGSAVMYESGKILYVGGGGYTGWDTPDPKATAPTETAEKIDLNEGSPNWTSAGSMSSPRRHHTATVLPDGQVLVTGGVSGGGFNNVNTGVRAAEIWDPAQPTIWTTLASNARTRAYHSVSLLMPDGTVLHGGGGDANAPGTSTPYTPERNHEIFRPPYLFKGARPTITDAPATVVTGTSFDVTTPAAGQITHVRLVRLGSVTHAFDANTMAVSLEFTAGDGSITVTAPPNLNVAPPGHYLLFVLNRNGIPSTGRIIQVQ
jgi:hypothetical protein